MRPVREDHRDPSMIHEFDGEIIARRNIPSIAMRDPKVHPSELLRDSISKPRNGETRHFLDTTEEVAKDELRELELQRAHPSG